MEERGKQLRAQRDALKGVLQELERQRRLQKTALQELDRQMCEGKRTKAQGREMRREINEARKLADRTEHKAIRMTQEVMDELRALEA